jgi:hypothetical protein
MSSSHRQHGDSRSARPSPQAERRKSPRGEVAWVARVQTAAGLCIECGVLDLSATGAKLLTDQPLAEGDHVTFVSPRFDPLSAKVAWSADGYLGLQFLDGTDRVMNVISGKTGASILPLEVVRPRE